MLATCLATVFFYPSTTHRNTAKNKTSARNSTWVGSDFGARRATGARPPPPPPRPLPAPPRPPPSPLPLLPSPWRRERIPPTLTSPWRRERVPDGLRGGGRALALPN